MINSKFCWSVDVAREVGVSTRTIRRYVDQGLISCIRDTKGRRRFRAEDIQQLKAKLGLSGPEANHP